MIQKVNKELIDMSEAFEDEMERLRKLNFGGGGGFCIPYTFDSVVDEPLNKVNRTGYSSPQNGKKEANGKQEFELDWEFIESMAKRMAKNKVKYGKDNWKRPMDIEALKQALFRHVLEVMKGNYNDEGKLDHFDAIALNCMFIRYQLLNHK
jgi:hypothetical protein